MTGVRERDREKEKETEREGESADITRRLKRKVKVLNCIKRWRWMATMGVDTDKEVIKKYRKRSEMR